MSRKPNPNSSVPTLDQPPEILVQEPRTPEKPPELPRRLFIGSERGGVWKTTLAGRLASFFDSQGYKVGIVQVDAQCELEAQFPGRVVGVTLPEVAAMHEDEAADAAALSPVYDMLLDPTFEFVVVDIGANLDTRVADFLITSDLHRLMTEARMVPVGLVPMRPEEQAVASACETARRFSIALPSARIVPVLCHDGSGTFTTLRDDVQNRFDTLFGPKLASGEVLNFNKLPPTAHKALARAGCTAIDFVALPVPELVRITGRHQAVARQNQGTVVVHLADLEMEVGRLFGPFSWAQT